jgi:hypothetical protein
MLQLEVLSIYTKIEILMLLVPLSDENTSHGYYLLRYTDTI